MPDFEDKIPISEFSYTNTLHNTDQAPIIQQDGAGWDNFRTSMADIGLHINKDMEYVTDLHTTSKKIIGAINELADGGGGSTDIISEASGSIATFNDGGDNIPVKSLITDIVAVQAGTGTPSPDNIRTITGFDTVVITNKDDLDTPTTTDTHTITLPETIYGGSLEATSGNGTKTFGAVDLGDLSWNYAGGTFRAIVSDAISPISGGDTTAICEIYNRVAYSSSIADLSFYLCANQLSASKYLVIKDDSYSGDTNAFKSGVTGKKLIYTLETTTPFTTTPEEIPTLSGVNNIYSNTGDVEVEYFNENADQMAELIKVLTR